MRKRKGRSKTLAGFVGFNMVLIAVACLFLRPTFAEWRRAVHALDLQESHLQIKERNRTDMEQNRKRLAQYAQTEAGGVPACDEAGTPPGLVNILSGISANADAHALTESLFEAAEPVAVGESGRQLVAVYVEAHYEGAYNRLNAFLETVAQERAIRVNTFTLEKTDGASSSLKLAFSVYTWAYIDED